MTAEMPPVGARPEAVDTPQSRPIDDPRAAQILATEHWSLLAGRSLAYNEAFSRAGMFLTFLSASLIVIGFVIASDRFADAVIPIVILLLAVNLFLGLATLGRIASASQEELLAVRGMNRIRHAYTEMVPGVQRYFVSSIHDDMKGVLSAYGGGDAPTSPLGDLAHGLSTTPGMLAAINCVILGGLAAVIAIGLGAPSGLAIAIGIAAFIVGFVLSSYYGYRAAMSQSFFKDPMFPSPPDTPPES